MQAPSIGVTASSARHVAREITRRLYPLHAQAVDQAAELTARQQAKASGAAPSPRPWPTHFPAPHRGGAPTHPDRLAAHVPPVRTEQPVQVDSVCAVVDSSGERVTVETSGRPGSAIPMLATVAQTRQE
ncbi:hypothetical protein [Streptomyces sp. JNUCC 63]